MKSFRKNPNSHERNKKRFCLWAQTVGFYWTVLFLRQEYLDLLRMSLNIEKPTGTMLCFRMRVSETILNCRDSMSETTPICKFFNQKIIGNSINIPC